MRFFDYIRTAFKNLIRQKIRTFLTISAITIGSLSVILMVSLIISIKESVNDFFAEMDAFNLITVSPDPDAAGNGGGILRMDNGNGEGKILDNAVLDKLKVLPHVAEITPIGGGIWFNNMKLEGQNKKTWPNIISYDPDTSVFKIPLSAGRKLTSSDMDKIIVSTSFADNYGFGDHPKDLIGKKVILIMKGGTDVPDWGDLTPPKPPEGDNKDWWQEQEKKNVEIPAEIVGVGQGRAFNDGQNFINIGWAKKLMTHVRWEWNNTCDGIQKEQAQLSEIDKKKDDFFEPQQNCQSIQYLAKTDDFLRNGYGSIIIKADDRSNIKTIKQSIEKFGYGVSTAEDMQKEIDKILLTIGAVLGAIGGISLFVAAIGIINTMVMAGYERIKEIGVMRACGATKSTIRWVFTFEAALLGFLGGIFGLTISYIIGRVGNLLVNKFSAAAQLPFDKISAFPWWLIAGVLVFTTFIGLVSGLGPAIRASRLNPVEALRYE